MSTNDRHDTPGGLDPEALLRAGAAPDSRGPEEAGDDPGLLDREELQRLFPDFEILELIGRGGMGVVCKARQRSLDRVVALKVMSETLSNHPRFVERFEREGRALARLSHPNIVTLHEFGRAGSRCFMVMEYVEGANLRALIRTGVRPAEALALVPQICGALQYAHEQGIVHRDIKPENILVDLKGRIKIADFGLAKLLPFGGGEPSIGRTATIIGTPAYMAPEQIENPGAVDHRADVYALGVVFYELLTGELPLGIYKPPSERVQVDVRLDEVVLRAMERKPELRYQQVAEMGTKIDSISQTPPPVYPKCGKEGRKRGCLHWLLVGMAIIFLILALLMGAFLTLKLVVPRFRSGGGSGSSDPMTKLFQPPDPDVVDTYKFARETVIQYQLDYDSVFPDRDWRHADESRLSLYPEGVWPDILGPIAGAAPNLISPSQFTLVSSQSEEAFLSPGITALACKTRLDWPEMIQGQYKTLICLDGIGPQGSIASETYAMIITRGNVEGRLVSNSYATVIIDGDLSGSLTSSSYINVLITGDMSGRIISKSYAMIYVLGDFTGEAELKRSRVYIDSFVTGNTLSRIKGSGEVYLAESDLAEGVHTIGDLIVTVGRHRDEPAP